MNRNRLFILSVFVLLTDGTSVQSSEPQPILDYDFTEPVIRKSGQYPGPDFIGTPEMDTEEKSLILHSGTYLVVPASKNLSLRKGATLYAVVKFEDDGKTDGSDNSHDMLFFKNGEFLLGRDRNSLYFNTGDGNVPKPKWNAGVQCGNIPLKRWTALTVTIRNTGGNNYTAQVYMDGSPVRSASFQWNGTGNAESVTIGRGWGGPWHMNGNIAEIKIFPWPLSPEECRKISDRSLSGRKSQQSSTNGVRRE